MGTVMNGNKWSGVCVNGNVVSGLVKNGVVFYKKAPFVYKRRIMVGDNLKGKTLYADFPDNYYSELTLSTPYETDLVGFSTTFNNIKESYSYSDNVGAIDIYGNCLDIPFYHATSFEGSFFVWENNKSVVVNNNKDYIVTEIENTSSSYRHIYIEDPNIRPIRAQDVINENTKIYFTWPDTLTPTGGSQYTSAVLYFNSLFQISYFPGENFTISAISNLSIEESIVLFNSASNINKSYLDLSEFKEGAAITGTIEFHNGTFPQEVLNGILVDETTLTSSGPEPTDGA